MTRHTNPRSSALLDHASTTLWTVVAFGLHCAAAARARRDRRRDERGFIAGAALGIVLLIGALTLVMLKTSTISTNTTREGREFTQARQGLDEAVSDALYKFNSTGLVTAGSGTRTDGRGSWVWTYDPTTRLLDASGTADDTRQAVTLPVRSRFVGSTRTLDDGTLSWGLAANGRDSSLNSGLWSHLLSVSAGASSVQGPIARFDNDADSLTVGVPPSLAVFGTADLAVNYSIANQAHAVSYSNGATVSGSSIIGGSAIRSSLTAEPDLVLLNQRFANTSGCQTFPRTTTNGLGVSVEEDRNTTLANANWLCASGNLTWTDATTQTWTGTKTLYVPGDLTIPADITTGTGQLHIYVGGKVTFASGSTAVRVLGNSTGGVFIYAPNGACAAELALVLRGALACKSITAEYSGNTFQYRQPSVDNTALSGSPTQRVFYNEAPGYIDLLTRPRP
ncbi:hypothetical protein ASF47_19290 [Nocardioides sp. Leaf285]|nr:hypothetical protein ASF47_19290 [Nocardioides sp. Leaf285]